MSVIRAVTTGLLAAVALVGCSSLQPGEPRTTSPASGNQGFLRTQLEQALFNEIVIRFSAAHPGPLEPKDYQNLLTELEQTVALTEISSLQQQTLRSLWATRHFALVKFPTFINRLNTTKLLQCVHM